MAISIRHSFKGLQWANALAYFLEKKSFFLTTTPEGVIRRSSTPPLVTGRYSITFSIPPIGRDRDGLVSRWERRPVPRGVAGVGTSSWFWVQHSDTPQTLMLLSSSNWAQSDETFYGRNLRIKLERLSLASLSSLV